MKEHERYVKDKDNTGLAKHASNYRHVFEFNNVLTINVNYFFKLLLFFLPLYF